MLQGLICHIEIMSQRERGKFFYTLQILKKKFYAKKKFYTNNKYKINKGWSCMHNIKTVIDNHTMNIHYQNNTRSDEKLLSFKSEIFIT